MKLLRDTGLIFQRQMLLLLRNPVWILVGIFQPVMYLLLFAPLLKPALQVRTNAQAYELFVPGLLVLLAIFGGLFQGFGLIAELRAGIIERSRVTPVSRLALLLNTVAQLVLLLSVILLPLSFAPGWLQGIADWNPFSWAVEGTRALFRGDLGASDVWEGLVIMAALAV